MSRKRNNQPATAYEYRRAIFLVQTLAMDNFDALHQLAEQWGVEPPTQQDLARTRSWTHSMAVKLAQHALAKAREETEERYGQDRD